MQPEPVKLKQHLVVEILRLLPLPTREIACVSLTPYFHIQHREFKVLTPTLMAKIALAGKEWADALITLVSNDYCVIRSNNYAASNQYRFMLTNGGNRVMEFDEHLRLPFLLYHAGLNVKTINHEVSSFAWLNPFYEGLEWNSRSPTFHESAGERVFSTYAAKHFWFDAIHSDACFGQFWTPGMRKALTSSAINVLSINFEHPPSYPWSLNAVQNIYVRKYLLLYKKPNDDDWIIDYDLLEHGPNLSFLEHFACNLPVSYTAVLKIIRSYRNIKLLIMSNVVLDTPVVNMDLAVVFEVIKRDVETLKELVENYPSETVQIRCNMRCNQQLPLSRIFDQCKLRAAGFIIYKSARQNFVRCTLTLNIIPEKKFITITIFFYPIQ